MNRHVTSAVMGLCCGVCVICADARAAVMLLGNPGFETGSLSPWTVNDGAPFVTNAQAHTGTFSCSALGGDEIKQTFSPVATSDIVEVSLWVKRTNGPFNEYRFYYSDFPETVLLLSGPSSNWSFFNLTANLAPGKHLSGFSIYGTEPGPAYLDDFTIATPEPSGALLAVAGLVGAAVGRGRRNGRVGRTPRKSPTSPPSFISTTFG
jgi:hypothetical protein